MTKPLAGLSFSIMHAGVMSQLVECVNWHINQGCSHIYVYLDRPKSDYTALFEDGTKITLVNCTQEYWADAFPAHDPSVEEKQTYTMRQSFAMAVRDGHAYVAAIDSDELYYAKHPLLDMLENTPNAGAFWAPVAEARHTESTNINAAFSANVFLKPSKDKTLLRSVYGREYKNLMDGFWGHRSGKTIFRIPFQYKDITLHRALPAKDEPPVKELDYDAAMVLHFDCGSLDTWRAKWAQRMFGVTVAKGMRAKRASQLQQFEQAYAKGRDALEQLYRRLFCLSAKQISTLKSKKAAFKLLLLNSDFGAPFLAENIVDENSFDLSLNYPPLSQSTTKYQFAMACDRHFVKPAYTCILSLMDKFDPDVDVHIYLLVDGISASDYQYLLNLQKVFKNLTLELCDETGKLDRDVGVKDTKRATFARLYLPEHVRSGRLVYIDSDMLVMKDISYLFDMDMEGAIVAGCPDAAALRIRHNPKTVSKDQSDRLCQIVGGIQYIENYLNAGLLVLDLDHPKYFENAKRCLEWLKTDAAALVQRDQDAVNIAFEGYKKRLSHKLNYMIQFFESTRADVPEIQKIKNNAQDADILHFSGKVKPWHANSGATNHYTKIYRDTVTMLEDKWQASCEFSYDVAAPKSGYVSLHRRVIRKLKTILG